jgi:hypothetical protein
MPIETLDDWNDQITSFGQCERCCTIEGQDAIFFESEQISGSIEVNGFEDAGNKYRVRTITWSGGGTSVQTLDSDFSANIGGEILEDNSFTTVDTPPLTGTPTTTYSGLIDEDATFAAGKAAVEAALNWTTMDINPGGGASFYQTTIPPYVREISFTRLKFRKADFGISTQIGSYLKLTFDLVDFGESGGDAILYADEVLTWSGAFDVNNQTDPAHFTAWYYIDPPSAPGSSEIRNLRWTKYQTTKYGNKPQNTDANGDGISPLTDIYP